MSELLLKIFVIILISHQTWAKKFLPVTPRVVFGVKSTGGSPFQVGFLRAQETEIDCGGSIISEYHILTAAHCLYNKVLTKKLGLDEFKIITGILQIDHISKGVNRKVKRAYIHPDYKTRQPCNDIAILRVDGAFPLGLTSLIAVVNMTTVPPKDGTKCKVSGWGISKLHSNVGSKDLREAVVEIIPFGKCQEIYMRDDIELSYGMICATNFSTRSDACQGDSGGPLVCNNILYGVVSTGMICGSQYPGIYADVAYFREWIDKVLAEDNNKIIGRSGSDEDAAVVDDMPKKASSEIMIRSSTLYLFFLFALLLF